MCRCRRPDSYRVAVARLPRTDPDTEVSGEGQGVFAGMLRNCINHFVYKFIALAKTVTPAGVPGGSRGGPHR
jgi:hypothetical protein